jgi:NAD+ synthase (glutamine-hydrolysing)
MKIAIAQINPVIGDLVGNAQQILTAAQIAVELGAELLLTPELSLCGYPPRDLLLNPSFVEQMSEQLWAPIPTSSRAVSHCSTASPCWKAV